MELHRDPRSRCPRGRARRLPPGARPRGGLVRRTAPITIPGPQTRGHSRRADESLRDVRSDPRRPPRPRPQRDPRDRRLQHVLRDPELLARCPRGRDRGRLGQHRAARRAEAHPRDPGGRSYRRLPLCRVRLGLQRHT